MRRCVSLGLGIVAVLAGAVVQAQQADPDPQFGRLHEVLKLTPAQEGPWAAYRAAAPAPAVADQRRQAAAAMFPKLTAPRRIDLVEAELKADLQDLQRQSAALKALYAALTPDQQRRFDDFTMAAPQADD